MFVNFHLYETVLKQLLSHVIWSRTEASSCRFYLLLLLFYRFQLKVNIFTSNLWRKKKKYALRFTNQNQLTAIEQNEKAHSSQKKEKEWTIFIECETNDVDRMPSNANTSEHNYRLHRIVFGHIMFHSLRKMSTIQTYINFELLKLPFSKPALFSMPFVGLALFYALLLLASAVFSLCS